MNDVLTVLTQTFENYSDPVFITDIYDTFIYGNREFYNFYKFRKSDSSAIYNKNLWDDYSDFNKLKLLLFNIPDKCYKCEYVHVKSDGERFTAEVNGRIIEDDINNNLGILYIIKDLSHKKSADNTINILNKRIEEQNIKIKNLERQIKRNNILTERTNRTRAQFLADMSHELRSPLNGILGYAQLGLNKEKLNSMSNRYFKAISDAGRYLLNLINNILDITKVDSGKVEYLPEIFSIKDVLLTTVNIVAPIAKNKNIDIKTHFEQGLPEIVIGDKGKVCQILVNLVTNAIKFTNQGDVTISVNKHTDVPFQIEFMIKDTGVGISKENQKIIFDPFVQINNKINDMETGTGLGLALSKRFIEFLGGKIWLTSEIGVGSEFYFTIPVKIETRFQMSKNIFQKPMLNFDTARIMLTDDDELNYSIVKDIFQDYNIDLLYAKSGDDTLKMLNSNSGNNNNIDLILMDIMMPGIDGYETTKIIKNTEKYRNIPIVAFTALASPNDKKTCLEYGCDDYISKPVDMHSLFTILNRWIDKNR